MILQRKCPFCGGEKQELKIAGNSSPEGIPMVVCCSYCGAGTEPTYCLSGDYGKVIKEWKEGIIYNSYIRRIN